ncbi:MAG: 3-methyl-2-oxobutanoate hydroxymethyltransferase [Thermodesulfatator sp.]|nr:MAG: 3-methyl-2-oxobutanoate hydroxymethyltransferase [Thermodesulfatator sp.]
MANITPVDIKARKKSGPPISMLTAYDYSLARMVDSSGIDIILVGDSLGMVMLGYDSTVPVTMEEMLHHCKAVSRGVTDALLVGDMPFMSYQVNMDNALMNASRFLKEAGCDAVKLEGGTDMAPVIEKLVRAGIPVMGHVGLTPQTAASLGGFKVQGRDIERARGIYEDALAVARAGAFSVVLECIPSDLAELITKDVDIPTIGIGAGPHCDGQVLVTNDLLGLYDKFTPKFVKRYLNLSPQIKEALRSFKKEVEAGDFPSPEESFSGGGEAVRAIKSQA